MFTITKTIHLHDTDAAGRLYFARLLRLAHEGYEAWMNAIGFSIGDILKGQRYALPIVRAEADYRLPLCVGDDIALELRATRVGESSFTLCCRVRKDGKLAGQVVTVHVAVSAKKGGKVALPARLRTALLNASRA